MTYLLVRNNGCLIDQWINVAQYNAHEKGSKSTGGLKGMEDGLNGKQLSCTTLAEKESERSLRQRVYSVLLMLSYPLSVL